MNVTTTTMYTGGMPEFGNETKGSVLLRSDHMNYGRPTLISNWDQEREADVKDYDISKSGMRDLSRATYHRIGNATDGSLPKTTYQDHSEQIFLKKYFEEQEAHKLMSNKDTALHGNIDRDMGRPKWGYGSVLPRHDPDFDKFYLETTHHADFKPPYPYVPKSMSPEELPDHTNANKRCISQFTDSSDYRRPGWNTWQDESGVYTNTHFKRQIYEPTKTIPNWEV